MPDRVPRNLGLPIELIKALMVLAGYLPYLWFSEKLFMPGWRWVILAIGVYLSSAMLLRNLTAALRWPLWARTAWSAFDFLLWFFSQKLGYWNSPITFPGVMLSADIIMVGWPYRRGLVHWLPSSLLILVGPALDPAFGSLPNRPGGEAFIGQYVLSQGIAPIIVYGFVRLAASLGEERARVARAHAEAERAYKAAELANSHLREHAREVEDLAVLRERNRLAREVHDTIAHAFTGTLMQLDAVKLLVRRDPERAVATLEQLTEHTSGSLAEVRRSVHALRPLQMEERQGLPALQQLVTTFAATTGVQAELAVAGTPLALPAAHDLCLYRAMQEGLTNAFRHGRAQQARVALTYEPDRVTLQVTDDGQGGTTSAAKPGLGLVGIRERAGLLGGTVTTGPRPGGGFALQVTLPLHMEVGA